eukprot:gene10657-biopygen4692
MEWFRLRGTGAATFETPLLGEQGSGVLKMGWLRLRCMRDGVVKAPMSATFLQSHSPVAMPPAPCGRGGTIASLPTPVAFPGGATRRKRSVAALTVHPSPALGPAGPAKGGSALFPAPATDRCDVEAEQDELPHVLQLQRRVPAAGLVLLVVVPGLPPARRGLRKRALRGAGSGGAGPRARARPPPEPSRPARAAGGPSCSDGSGQKPDRAGFQGDVPETTGDCSEYSDQSEQSEQSDQSGNLGNREIGKSENLKSPTARIRPMGPSVRKIGKHRKSGNRGTRGTWKTWESEKSEIWKLGNLPIGKVRWVRWVHWVESAGSTGSAGCVRWVCPLGVRWV